jgi:hypothetical protein
MPGLPKELQEFRHLFEEREPEAMLPEHKPWDLEIILKEGATIKPQKLRRFNQMELEKLREFLNTYLPKRYIRKSESEYGCFPLFVGKPDGSIRTCVDYRPVNEATVKNQYPLPRIDEMQDRLQGCTWFTILDQREAFHRIRIKEGHEKYTAFKTPYGMYEFVVVPFGLTNAPAAQQSHANDMLREYLYHFVVVYLDDVLIFTKGTREDHIDKVKLVLREYEKRDMLFKLSKCTFFAKEVEFLGHTVTTQGLCMQRHKIKEILEWPTPTTVKEVQTFLGKCGYYRSFIKQYSDKSKSLTEMTQKDKPFQWTAKEQESFETLKEAFRKGEMRRHFDPTRPSVLNTDASDRAIAGVLQQPDDNGKLMLVACYAKSLNKAEKNYDVHDKELLAIVHALRHWRVELQGAQHEVLIRSDHHNLRYFMTTKELTPRQARWYEKLCQYNFRIEHCKGKDNVVADALSRRPDLIGEREREEATLLSKDSTGSLRLEKMAIQATSLVTAENPTITEIRKTPRDNEATRLLDNDDTKESNGLILFKGMVYVPKALRGKVLRENHDDPTAGHFGNDKTIERLMRMYWWPGMWKDTRQYIRECECQRNKTSRHATYGHMQSIPQLREPWKSVAMDFIVKLPKSKDPTSGREYDSIFTITDRLTKEAKFVPFNEATDAPGTAHIVMREVVATEGLPDEWITDRDSKFMSHFWQTLMARLGIRHNASTAYHQQSNGQDERLNQTLEQYLRSYVDYDQTNWVELLPVAQFAYNSSKNATTGMTPFFANRGREPTIDRLPIEIQQQSHDGRLSAERMKDLHKILQMDIEFMNSRAKAYYDERHQEAPPFRRGEKVFLLRRNIKTKRPCDKLDHKKLGPFEIEEKLGPLNFKLKLPKNMRMHPIFHVSLLEKAPQNAKRQRMEIEGEEEWEVEQILDQGQIDGQEKYLVKWKGYPPTESTWEPIEHLRNAQAALGDFRRAKQQNPSAGTRPTPRTTRHSTRRQNRTRRY